MAEPVSPYQRAAGRKRQETQQLFQANIVTRVGVHLHKNRPALDLTVGATAAPGADPIAKVQAALTKDQAFMLAVRTSDHGKWKNFYSNGDGPLEIAFRLAAPKARLDQSAGYAQYRKTC
jgi:hypothetical protein